MGYILASWLGLSALFCLAFLRAAARRAPRFGENQPPEQAKDTCSVPARGGSFAGKPQAAF